MLSIQMNESSASRQLRRPGLIRASTPAMSKKLRVLIVDDNAASAESLGRTLVDEGCSYEIISSGEQAQDVVRKLGCDVVVCTARMRSTSEFDLPERLKALQPDLPVIVSASANEANSTVEVVRRGAFQYADNPLDTAGLINRIICSTVDAVQYGRVPLSGQQLSHGFGGDGSQCSPAMRELNEAIALVARSNTPVLILGETGTGKERVARAIHAGSSRKEQPFVAVNTSAIPEQLLESEVFGHVRGAFTGATQARRGLLQEAHGGTLMLDEIGDMPILLQPKLLRVLQFGEARPVGSDRASQVDVRVIAATHRNLDTLVSEGTFREDLRYRLNVIPLVVPSLRNRREDIQSLVLQFLQEARERNQSSPVNAFSDEAMNMLTQAAWPGNVRELENAVERLVVLGRKAEVTATDLSFLREKPPGEEWPALQNSPWTLKEMNLRYLDWVLAQTNGDKTRAAGILGINLSTLYRWERARG